MSNYFKPVIEDRFDRAARLIKEARSSKESSAPLDPSRVRVQASSPVTRNRRLSICTFGWADTVDGRRHGFVVGGAKGSDYRAFRYYLPEGDYSRATESFTNFVPDEPRPLPTRNELVKAMHDDYLKDSEPRLTVTAREHLADAVLTFLRGEVR